MPRSHVLNTARLPAASAQNARAQDVPEHPCGHVVRINGSALDATAEDWETALFFKTTWATLTATCKLEPSPPPLSLARLLYKHRPSAAGPSQTLEPCVTHAGECHQGPSPPSPPPPPREGGITPRREGGPGD